MSVSNYTTEVRDLIVAKIGGINDNVARAEATFRGRTPEQMLQKYGQSDQTCAEILESYRDRKAHWQSILDWYELKDIGQ